MQLTSNKLTFFSFILISLMIFFAPATASSDPLLYDDFDEIDLNSDVWNVIYDFGSIELEGGILTTKGTPDYERIDSFNDFQAMGYTLFASARIQLAGDYQKFGFRINPGEYGPISGFYFDTLESENGNVVSALIRDFSGPGDPEILTVTLEVSWEAFHVFTIEWSPTEIAFHIDGVEKARAAFESNNLIPVGLWNDRPGIMQTDWVEVINVVPVIIDIKPGSDPNSINPSSKGVIPVALLSTDSFDAMMVDPETVKFGTNGMQTIPAHYGMEDINEDGMVDYIFHFRTQQTGIDCDTESAGLTGSTAGGSFEGFDSVRPVACNAKKNITPPGLQNKPSETTPPAFENHPVHDSKPGKDNHPTPNTPGQNKVKLKAEK